MKICSIEGCESRAITRGWCQKHYFRWRRHGDPEKTVNREPIRNVKHCLADDCNEQPKSRGYCSMHAARMFRHGSPDAVIDLNDREIRRKQDHPNWKGDEVKYEAVHHRLYRWKGKASEYLCVDCGNPAAHWSYSNADPDERLCDQGRPYSTDPAHYSPRCIPCHSDYDSKSSQSQIVAPADVGAFLFPDHLEGEPNAVQP